MKVRRIKGGAGGKQQRGKRRSPKINNSFEATKDVGENRIDGVL